MSEIFQEYLPYVGAVKWIKKDVIIESQNVESNGNRVMVWHRFQYADTNTGPWTDFRWMPFGLLRSTM